MKKKTALRFAAIILMMVATQIRHYGFDGINPINSGVYFKLPGNPEMCPGFEFKGDPGPFYIEC